MKKIENGFNWSPRPENQTIKKHFLFGTWKQPLQLRAKTTQQHSPKAPKGSSKILEDSSETFQKPH